MAGFNGGGGGGASSLLYNHNNKLPQPFFLSPSSSSFLGSSSMMSFEDACGGKRSERPFYCTYDQDENGEDDYDDYLYQPEKKRRLTGEQVQFLEKSFEVENKLEPERKIQLAKDLGLQPRQVAIWFQNRRARWKNKQLEKDFDSLQSNYNTLKSDYDGLLQEKEKLQAEVVLLTDKLLSKEKTQRDDSSPSNTYVEPKRVRVVEDEPIVDRLSESEDQAVSVFGYKQEDLNSVKSDVIDSSDSSPRYVDASHSSLADSSAYAFEADHSDISQDDQDYLSNTLLMPSTHAFFKITDVNNNVDVDPPPHSSCNNYHPLPGEDHHHHYDSSLFWPY